MPLPSHTHHLHTGASLQSSTCMVPVIVIRPVCWPCWPEPFPHVAACMEGVAVAIHCAALCRVGSCWLNVRSRWRTCPSSALMRAAACATSHDWRPPCKLRPPSYRASGTPPPLPPPPPPKQQHARPKAPSQSQSVSAPHCRTHIQSCCGSYHTGCCGYIDSNGVGALALANAGMQGQGGARMQRHLLRQECSGGCCMLPAA